VAKNISQDRESQAVFVCLPWRWRNTPQLPATGYGTTWGARVCRQCMDKRPRLPRSRGRRSSPEQDLVLCGTASGAYLCTAFALCSAIVAQAGRRVNSRAPVPGIPGESKVMASETSVQVRWLGNCGHLATSCFPYVVARMESVAGLRSNSTGPISAYYARTHWYD